MAETEAARSVTLCKSGLARLLLSQLYCAWPFPSERKSVPFPLANTAAHFEAMLLQRVDLVLFSRCTHKAKHTALSLRIINWQWQCRNSSEKLCRILAFPAEMFCSLLWHDWQALLLRFADSSVLVGLTAYRLYLLQQVSRYLFCLSSWPNQVAPPCPCWCWTAGDWRIKAGTNALGAEMGIR